MTDAEPDPTRTEPPRTEPSQAEPSQAEPSQAEPSQAEPPRPPSVEDVLRAATQAAAQFGVPPEAIARGMAAASSGSLEADLDALMSDRLDKLDEMLAGLDQLVQKIEGDIAGYEKRVDPPQ
ncbi:hypothetical protein [Umezawaea beigongshangensis]|uniref:hypothetical protein n=1 Tax=Umezawaea beigongshangensis TaxID=2780383 RepID=UPI0018F20657|nr:hypothetical protein [Umezawaea beigongshangensis]